MLHFDIDYKKVKDIAQGIPANFDAGAEEAQKEVIQVGKDILYLMKKEGVRIRYPVNWDTNKQLKAFFASKGFGAGIPTVRTSDYISSWNLLPVRGGFRLLNSDPKARHLAGRAKTGTGQSKIHATRWPLFHDAIVSVFARWAQGGWATVRKAFLRGFRADFRKNRRI